MTLRSLRLRNGKDSREQIASLNRSGFSSNVDVGNSAIEIERIRAAQFITEKGGGVVEIDDPFFPVAVSAGEDDLPVFGDAHAVAVTAAGGVCRQDGVDFPAANQHRPGLSCENRRLSQRGVLA